MSEHILTDWDAEKVAKFEREPVVAHHNLHKRDMFSDEGLIDLLDRYPREKLGIYCFGTDPLQNTEIEAGIRNKGNIEVLSGLNEGDKIIAEGLTKVRPGMTVKPIIKSQ